jgi:hypothetical protein
MVADSTSLVLQPLGHGPDERITERFEKQLVPG